MKNSSSVGIELDDSATFAAGSTALVISGSASAPLRISAWALTSVPDGDYSGNAVDRIILKTHERIGVSNLPAQLTMHARNVPYRVGGYGETPILTLGAPTGTALTTLRIEAGATITWKPDFGLQVTSVNDAASGELIVEGTAEAPVTFTSDQPQPRAGDWRGLMFGATPGPATKLDHVVIAYAGSENTQTSGYSCGTPPSSSPGGIKGALSFAANKPVTRQILTNSLVKDSGSNGIDRGWTGDEVDYLATNTFSHVAYCLQTSPRPKVGQCPDPAPCPMAP